MDTANLYKQVTLTTRRHLGSTAERFVARQIREHTKKDPDALEPQDLRKLLNWIELAMRTIYRDHHAVEAYIRDLRTLIPPNTNSLSAHGKEV